MLPDAPNINHLFAGLIIEELIRNGVEWFVICPGSRSTPLAWAVASHPRAKHIVHFDERGAAFHALGIAKATLKPAAFICTSGTATANALPAVVEASHSGVPMVLLTADRPAHLQGAGANQTINQRGLYREFVRHESNFAVTTDDFDAASFLSALDVALHHAMGVWPGPVHLNCQFDEPLAPVASSTYPPDWRDRLAPLTEWMESQAAFTQGAAGPAPVDEAKLARLRTILRRDVPGLVVVGQLSGPRERDEVYELLKRLQWPIIPDITSGLRLGPPALWGAGHYANELFDHAQTLLHLGGPVTSRRLLEAISRFQTADSTGREFVRISQAPGHLDPHGNVTLRICAPPSVLREAMPEGESIPIGSRWPARFPDRDAAIFEVLSALCPPKDAPTELSAAATVALHAPEGATLFAGNSMPIRDLDAYTPPNPKRTTWVAANRGASGIDGNIATAAGVARGTGRPVVAIIGDLATLHDLNSLALLRDLPAPVVLVVLNNDGGGIFHFLPIAEHSKHFERLFGTPHGLKFEHAAAMFEIGYHRPSTNLDLAERCRIAVETGESCVIEISSNREENRRQHREVDLNIRDAVENARRADTDPTAERTAE